MLTAYSVCRLQYAGVVKVRGFPESTLEAVFGTKHSCFSGSSTAVLSMQDFGSLV